MDKEKIIGCRPVGADELTELRDFLGENKLPFDDIRLEGNWFAVYRSQSGKIAGAGGLEFYGQHCLLRSLAVAPEFRGLGCGSEIVKDLISQAIGRELNTIFLLTETAEAFFESFGFQKISRDEAPMQIRASSEFSSVCPVSAAFMMKKLR